MEAANQLYVSNNYRLLGDFQSTLENHFGAPAQNVDFGSDKTRIDINKWVEDFTKTKIKNLLPGGVLVKQLIFGPFRKTHFEFTGSIDSLTRLVLVNAVYFKGNWMKKFDSALTKTEPFYLGSKDTQMDAQMMHIDGKFRTGFIEALDARALELPYQVPFRIFLYFRDQLTKKYLTVTGPEVEYVYPAAQPSRRTVGSGVEARW